MATTYRAHDLLDDTQVALKLLSGRALETSFVAEFERLRGLVHPHLIRVRSFGRDTLDGELRAFYTADLIEGGTLAQRAKTLGFQAVMPALVDVLDALSFLHALGLRHGDLKPDNVLCTPDGRGVLIDLGCASPLGAAMREASGTPHYMAPELLAGGAADERADLYAFGVMLGELGAGGQHARLVKLLTAADPAKRMHAVSDLLSALGVRRELLLTRLSPLTRMVGRGRERELAAQCMAACFANVTGPRHVWIHGPSGIGRTRLWRELCWDLESRVAVHEVRGTQPECLRNVLARATGVEVAAGAEGLLTALRTLERAACPCVIALDGAERLDARSAADLTLVLRNLSAESRVCFLITSLEPAPSGTKESGLSIALLPLSEAALQEWSRGCIPSSALQALALHTGGYPAYMAETLDALAAGRMRVSDLQAGQAAGVPSHQQTLARVVEQLDPHESEALVRLALQSEHPILAAPPISSHELPSRLFALQLVRREHDHAVLARRADVPALLAACPQQLVHKLRLKAARELERDPRPEALAARLVHLSEASKPTEAAVLFEAHTALALSTPRPFLPFVKLSLGKLSPALCVQAAGVARLCTEPGLALQLLASARKTRPTARLLVAIYREAVEVYLTIGKVRRAERLSRSLIQGKRQEPALNELRCRALLKVAAYEQAAELAARTLTQSKNQGLRASLLENLATAEAYLGQHEAAFEHIAEAAALHEGAAPRAQARCLAFQSFVAFRAGDTARALESAERVRALSELHGYDDLLVNALTHLGTAREMQGALGSALESYERGLRLAVALDRQGAVRTLRANLANLSMELGLFERAQVNLTFLEADRGLTPALSYTVRLYAAELCLVRAQHGEARDRLLACVQELAPRGLGRELTEALALLALAETGRVDAGAERVDSGASRANGDTARAHAEQALQQAEALGSPDLRARVATLFGRVAFALGEGQAAAARLEQELVLASAARLQPLVAGLHTVLFQIYEAAAAQSLSRDHHQRALRLWERIALDLAPSARDAFWAHPWRAPLRRELTESQPGQPHTSLNLRRIFELNRRLNSTLSVRAVLDYAIDAATEITSAERGFVLLVRPGQAGFEVAVARNFDRKQLAGEELKLSRSIAERVIGSDEPLLTLDAASDTRFAQQASVHAMRLKSVLCVPIRSPSGVLGALYLDTRLQRARFEQADLDLLIAFADQVAVALTNARLVSELESRTRELAKEKLRVEALSAGQAQQIVRLEAELEKRQDALESRYDYSQIVGRSASMREVLGVLDRVLDSDLSILIQGESGTGKELVARAIHFNSQRKAQPFLGLNCAALPENLLESELFGVVKGAFTGADRDRPGLFVAAQGGTLFLDELQELTLSMQAKLLRALQDREVRAVGATRATAFDVRIVCASNRPLSECVKEGAFREDLFYRVAVVDVTLPPLRTRSEDIVPIAEALLLRRALESTEGKEGAKTLAADAIRALLAHTWPGNVRELENTLLRASVMAEGTTIAARDLGLDRSHAGKPKQSRSRQEYEQREAERLLSLLEAERWNISRVAKNMGLPRNTLYRRLVRYGIAREP